MTTTTRPRDVNYPLATGELNVVDNLPANSRGSRPSPIEDALDEIKAHQEVHGRWVEVASYGNGNAASSQSNELRKRHGYKPNYEGWSFATARADAADGTPRTGLFAKFDPKAVTAEGQQEHKDEAARRKAKAATRKPRTKRETDKKSSAAAESARG